MILRLLCIWLVLYSLLSSLMHGTMNLKYTLVFCGKPFSIKICSPTKCFFLKRLYQTVRRYITEDSAV
jgi:hypothetical protein